MLNSIVIVHLNWCVKIVSSLIGQLVPCGDTICWHRVQPLFGMVLQGEGEKNELQLFGSQTMRELSTTQVIELPYVIVRV